MSAHRKSQSGQALTEYVVLLIFVCASIFFLFRFLPRSLIGLEKPVQDNFKYTYQFGDPRARGYDDETGGEPQYHPRYYRPGNFRLFGRGSQ